MNRTRLVAPSPALAALLARLAAGTLCRVAARLYRAAATIERPRPSQDESSYARQLVAAYGKLD